MQVSALSQTHQLQLKIKGKRVEFSHEHLMEWLLMHATNMDKIRNTHLHQLAYDMRQLDVADIENI